MHLMYLGITLLWLTGVVGAVPPLEKRAGRTSPPSGCKVVRQGSNSNGEFPTLGAAVSSLSGGGSACIFVYGGTYKENFTISYGGPLTIYGYTTDTGSYKDNTVKISRSMTSHVSGSLDTSSTINAKSANLKMYNINIENTYGKGAQAVSLVAQGQHQGYYGCGFYGYQDTLYAKSGAQYYSKCYIEGADDFIFGDAAAWFNQCTISCNGPGSITATSRDKADDPAWYVFDHCMVDAKSGVSGLASQVYLGRPWRVLSRVIYQYSYLGDIINPTGWTTMAQGATPIYMEYNNNGPGSSTAKREWVTKTDKPITMSELWQGSYDWIDTSY
ncbi:uncharacterized protein E0L32_009888 [Thyridium curvatum]|uniref:pectinesterase n=1 Tax=Thyridium curvatum TaxID=1093900 RepID=A0A507AUU4_9PEZI|nr:uncharacterized protein E0L32_009888 [Thyridium curvatum]TPX08699.1 hypothetical protein E0L32_009888 [Thyridium curvatum]